MLDFFASLRGIATIVGLAVVGVVVWIIWPNSQVTPPPPPPPPPPVCPPGPESLRLIGSTAFMPIAKAAAGVYMHDCPDATITVTGGDSAYGLSQLQGASFSQAGSTVAMYDGSATGPQVTGLTAYPQGAIIFSVVAHDDLVPGGEISAATLKKIFSMPGERGVVAVGRRSGSGSRLTFVEKVLLLGPSMPAIQPDPAGCPPPAGENGCTADSTQDLLNFVNKTSDAIGYAETDESLAAYPNVSALDIGNAEPTAADVLNHSYKYWTVEHLYASAQPATLTKDFLSFLPNYFESHPEQGFIACSQSRKKLEPDC